jgi:ABC-type protease/lipase transport system fused ATPase/permease subunit
LAGGRKHYLRAFFLRDFCCIFFLIWCRHFFKCFLFLIFVEVFVFVLHCVLGYLVLLCLFGLVGLKFYLQVFRNKTRDDAYVKARALRLTRRACHSS